MNKNLLFFFCVSMIFFCHTLGCSSKPAASGKDAIKASENLRTNQEKVDYLVKEAKGMYKKEMFHDAVEVCKHILQSLDKKSKEAKTLLDDALKELGSLGKEILEGVKKNIGNYGHGRQD